jgi:aspartyl-tRNA(Asn)/glutamyl-tRNA(Gln) amidotransferase subunit C
MSIDKHTAARIANLARIRLDDAGLEGLVKEFNGILNWVGQLNEVDTEGVPPLTSVVENALAMREDKVTDGGYAEDVLANAPKQSAGFFVVPKVVE